MKKLIFGGFAVLLALALITCDGETPVNTIGLDYVDWEDGGTSLTLYIDGSAPVANASRALNKPLAQATSNFYEVVFYHSTGTGTPRVARASWKRGEKASISNVPRGVTYNSAGAATIANATAGSHAVLFVGRDDGTLLAVGTLDGGSQTITPATTSVTFLVQALEASLRLQADNDATGLGVTGDTFLTNAGNVGTANTPAANITRLDTASAAGGFKFPVYSIPTAVAGTQDTLATFQLNPSAGLASLLLGVRAVGPAAAGQTYVDYIVPPEFSTPGGTRAIGGDSAHETTAEITGLTAGASFPNPIQMTITAADYSTSQKKGGLLGITFSIPVYAITTLPVAGYDAMTWYVRPGFGTSQYLLDDGSNDRGGSILLAVGAAVINNLDVLSNWN